MPSRHENDASLGDVEMKATKKSSINENKEGYKPPEDDTPKGEVKNKTGSLKRMFQYSKKEWKLLSVGMVALLIAVVCQALIPYFTGKIIDSVQEDGGDYDELRDTSLMLIYVSLLGKIDCSPIQSNKSYNVPNPPFANYPFQITILGAVALAIRGFLYNLAGERIVVEIRQDLYNAVIQKDIAYFDKIKSGDLTNRLSSDTTLLQDTLSSDISVFIRNFITFFATLTFLFLISWKLTCLMLGMVPLVAVIVMIYGNFINKNTKKYQDALADASVVAVETIGNARTVRSFATEDREMSNYQSKMQTVYKHGFTKALAYGIFNGLIAVLANGVVIAVLWYGGSLVIEEELSTGDLAAFLLYTVNLAMSLTIVGSMFTEIMKSLAAADKIFEIIDTPTSVNLTSGQELQKVAGGIKFDNVKFAYPSRPETQVLTDFTLDIPANTRVALVGPSGGGKSTVVQLLQRFYHPLEGKISLDGIDIEDLNRKSYLSKIGYVSQEPVLFSGTIEENIAYSLPVYTSEDVVQAAKFANAYDFISEETQFPDGFKTLVGERGIKLSGGQKQRVSIARAIIKNPKILLLDEATSALDAESEHLVQRAIDDLIKGATRTVLIVAHRLSTIREADKIVVIKHGKIVESGKHDDLLGIEDGIYKKFMKRQLHSADHP
eukprot:CAMPEP_0115038490 /NCGR_PEP_ID=MMETSP0216-20121206/43440_1 /TAXON_ID=223996 /ORGANISM="Protocruzia adherens, Strain Boccale" /LENGTH=662 /DNA_ID=CAMNT_0002418901 /DNA_START=317 /DNA_END=2301 /DNA_ORIENTATION=-